MAGFGKTPFGRGPFGRSSWSKAVLWGLIPEVYQVEDQNNSNLLQRFIDGVRPSYDRLLRKMQDWDKIRDPLKVRTRYNESSRLLLGPRLEPVVDPQQRGRDGQVSTLQVFQATTARFTTHDVGKNLLLRNSQVQGNNRTVVIVALVSARAVLTTPALQYDVGPLLWELRPQQPVDTTRFTVEVHAGDVSQVGPGWLVSDGFAEFEVLARRQFLTTGPGAYLTYRDGTDGWVDPSLRFRSATAALDASHIGRMILVSGSAIAQNNDLFEIIGVDTTVQPPAALLDGFVVADQTSLAWSLMQFPQLDIRGRAYLNGMVEQFGSDLSANVSGLVASLSGQFHPTDVGKILTLGNSPSGLVVGDFTVQTVLNATQATVVPLPAATESGLSWELRAPTATGPIEKEGQTAEILSVVAGVATVQVPIPVFGPEDAGRLMILEQAPIAANNGPWQVLAVVSPTLLTLTVPPTVVPDIGPIAWQISSGDLRKVEAHASSMLASLAPDFGIRIDNQDSEARQRSWVANVSQWIDVKGHATSYAVLGSISGFTVTTVSLYKLDYGYLSVIPGAHLFKVGDGQPGHSGSDGQIVADSPVQFFSATAKFTAGDIGKSLLLDKTQAPQNSGVFEIVGWLGSTTVQLKGPTLLPPDLGTGPGVRWDLVELYTDLPPALPLFDEFNADEIVALTGTTIDTYCWEPSFDVSVDALILSVAPLGGNLYELVASGHPDAVTSALPWQLHTADSVYYLESVPVQVSPTTWSFTVLAAPLDPVILGAATLTYQCSPHPACGWCAASAILLTAEEGSIAFEGPVQRERAFERLLRREQDATPIHVRLIPQLRASLTATWGISCTLTVGLELYAPLYAPWTAYYDEVLGDLIPADTALQVTLTTP